MRQDIFIIYYVFINPSNDWKNIIIGQLQDIVNSNILYNRGIYNTNIDVVLSCHTADLIEMARIMIEEFFAIRCITNYNIIYASDNNFYEYPGIYQLYLRGRSASYESDARGASDATGENSDAICLYLHTKGMSYHSNSGRELCEVQLTRNILHSWERTISILKENKSLNKATIACSQNGWGWFNFYWVKASYLRKCVEPIKSDDRYYYESWVGRYGSNTYEDCYNLISPETKHYEPHEAMYLLSRLSINFN